MMRSRLHLSKLVAGRLIEDIVLDPENLADADDELLLRLIRSRFLSRSMSLRSEPRGVVRQPAGGSTHSAVASCPFHPGLADHPQCHQSLGSW